MHVLLRAEHTHACRMQAVLLTHTILADAGRPGRRMVSLGKVTAPKPVNLPSQRYAFATSFACCAVSHGACICSSICQVARCEHGVKLHCRRENNGFDPNVSIVPK